MSRMFAVDGINGCIFSSSGSDSACQQMTCSYKPVICPVDRIGPMGLTCPAWHFKPDS